MKMFLYGILTKSIAKYLSMNQENDNLLARDAKRDVDRLFVAVDVYVTRLGNR